MSYAQKLDFDADLARRDRWFVDFDFVRNLYRFGKLRTSSLQALPGLSYTGGAGFKTALNQAGEVVGPFAANDPGVGDRGVGMWKASTSLLLGSAAPATQSVTVAASPYVLSFQGTGSIALSGVSSAGPLNGSGASTFVELPFTPTAGTLTLTVTGDVRNANLELGVKRTPWIPTTVAAATRTADSLSLSLSRRLLPSELTLLVEWEAVVTDGQLQMICEVRNTATPSNGQNTINMGRNAGGNYTLQVTDSSESGLANITTSSGTTAGIYRATVGLSPGAAPTTAINGSPSTGNAAGRLAGMNQINIGMAAGPNSPINGYIRRLVVDLRRRGNGADIQRSRL